MATESASLLTVLVADLPMATESASLLTVMVADLPSEIVMTVEPDLPLVIGSASLLTVKVVLIQMYRKESESPLPSLTALTSSKIPVPEVRKRIEILSSGLMTRKRMINNPLSNCIQRDPRLNLLGSFYFGMHFEEYHAR
jgi:hypothetical protein